jgi:hypothetical protein
MNNGIIILSKMIYPEWRGILRQDIILINPPEYHVEPGFPAGTFLLSLIDVEPGFPAGTLI